MKQSLCITLLHLGHCEAGLNDYPNAIVWYEKIEEKFGKYLTFKDLTVELSLSKAHAYQNMENFKEALKAFSKVRDNCGFREKNAQQLHDDFRNSRTTLKRCYWEATYEMANCYASLGNTSDSNYNDANPLYEEAIDLYKALPTKSGTGDFGYGGALIWLYLSYGDCLLKQWKPNNFEKAKELYNKSLETVKSEIPNRYKDTFKGHILYRLGRLHIVKKEFEDAEKIFSKIQDYREEKVYLYDISIVQYEFQIYYGYILLHAENDDKKERGRERIDRAVESKDDKVMKVHKEVSQMGSGYEYKLCDPYYQLAMGLAMQDKEHKSMAIELLKTLTTEPYNFKSVKEWAKSADCLDFPELKEDTEFRKVVELS